MDERKLEILNCGIKYLSRILDSTDYNSIELPDAVSVSVKNLIKSLEKLTSKCGGSSTVAIPDKLFLIFSYIKEKQRDVENINGWYFCALCNEDTTLAVFWDKHVASEQHLSNLRKFDSVEQHCEVCSIKIIAPRDHISAYFDSPSHKDVDDHVHERLSKPVNKVDRKDVAISVIFYKLCEMPFFMIEKNTLMKSESTNGYFKRCRPQNISKQNYLIRYVSEYFRNPFVVFHCLLCKKGSTFNRESLIKHFREEEHNACEKSLYNTSVLGLLLCSFCGHVYLGTESEINTHYKSHFKTNGLQMNNTIETLLDHSFSSLKKETDKLSEIINNPNFPKKVAETAVVANTVTNSNLSVPKYSKDGDLPLIFHRLCEMSLYEIENETLVKSDCVSLCRKRYKLHDFTKHDLLFFFVNRYFDSVEPCLQCLVCNGEVTQFVRQPLIDHFRDEEHKEHENKLGNLFCLGLLLCSFCEDVIMGTKEQLETHKDIHCKSSQLIDNKESKSTDTAVLKSSSNVGMEEEKRKESNKMESESTNAMVTDLVDKKEANCTKIAVTAKETKNNISVSSIFYRLYQMHFFVFENNVLIQNESTNEHKRIHKPHNFNKHDHLFAYVKIYFKTSDIPLHCLVCEQKVVKFARYPIIEHFQDQKHILSEKKLKDIFLLGLLLCKFCKTVFMGTAENFAFHEKEHFPTCLKDNIEEKCKKNNEVSKNSKTKRLVKFNPKSKLESIQEMSDNTDNNSRQVDIINTEEDKINASQNINDTVENNQRYLIKNLQHLLKMYQVFRIEDNILLEMDMLRKKCLSIDTHPTNAPFTHFESNMPNSCKYYCDLCNINYLNSAVSFVEHIFLNHQKQLTPEAGYSLIICIKCSSVKFCLQSLISASNHETHTSKNEIVVGKNSLKYEGSKEVIRMADFSDEDIENESKELLETEPLSQKERKESLDLILNYILDRYYNVPFCRNCPTAYFCYPCGYTTSYIPYWRRHQQQHKKFKENEKYFTHFCKNCGLESYIQENEKHVLNTSSHDKIDSQFALPFTKPDEHFMSPNCIKFAHHLEEKNGQFTTEICHCACTLSCTDFRLFNHLIPEEKSVKREKDDSINEVDGFSTDSSNEDLGNASEDNMDILSDDENEEALDQILLYIQDRFSKAPFCKQCPTAYYCHLCRYSTSYLNYWKQHLGRKKHLQNSGHNLKYCSSVCKDCGLETYCEEKEQHLIQTNFHKKVDENFKDQPATGKHYFALNCQIFPEYLAKNNEEFLSSILHSACNKYCKFVRLFKAYEIGKKKPFILVNKSLPFMEKQMQKYISNSGGVLNRSLLSYVCLDCIVNSGEVTAQPKMTTISELKDHLFSCNHITTSAEEFNRVMAYCCTCNTLFVASSKESLNCAALYTSSACDHIRLCSEVLQTVTNGPIIRKTKQIMINIEAYLMTSYLKCFFFKNSLLFSCIRCNEKFKSIELCNEHLESNKHCSKSGDMFIFLCYLCGKVFFYDGKKVPFPCRHLKNAVKLYSSYKFPSNITFVPRGEHLKTLSPILIDKIENEIKSDFSLEKLDPNSYWEIPIINNNLEVFSLIVTIPNHLTNVINKYNTYVFTNVVSFDLIKKKLNLEDEVWEKITFFCVMCEVDCSNLNSFYEHLGLFEHNYNCYSCSKSNLNTPFSIYCSTCNYIIVFGNEESVERHFSTLRHLKKKEAGSETAVTSPLQDNRLWNCTTLSLDFKKVFSGVPEVTETLNSSMVEMDKTYTQYINLKDRLRKDIQSTLSEVFPEVKVYFFGSRETGLAKSDSDVDVFVDTGGNYFRASPQVDKNTEIISNLFRKKRRNFEIRETIVGNRVPLVKIRHRSFNIYADVNCLDASGVENSKLLRVYLSYDEKVWWLVVAVREWASLNLIRGSRAINSYSFVWLVLFFLMQPHVSLVPPVNFIQKLHVGSKVIINGWDYSFSTDLPKIREKFGKAVGKHNVDFFTLLRMFFQFYSTLKTEDVVLCPLTGNIVPRSVLESDSVPSVYCDSKGRPITKTDLRMSTACILLDPLLLNYNLLRNVHGTLLDHFKILCCKTLTYCEEWLNH